jgi:hypothetical protein
VSRGVAGGGGGDPGSGRWRDLQTRGGETVCWAGGRDVEASAWRGSNFCLTGTAVCGGVGTQTGWFVSACTRVRGLRHGGGGKSAPESDQVLDRGPRRPVHPAMPWAAPGQKAGMKRLGIVATTRDRQIACTRNRTSAYVSSKGLTGVNRRQLKPSWAAIWSLRARTSCPACTFSRSLRPCSVLTSTWPREDMAKLHVDVHETGASHRAIDVYCHLGVGFLRVSFGEQEDIHRPNLAPSAQRCRNTNVCSRTPQPYPRGPTLAHPT